MSEHFDNSILIIQLDNRRFHKTKKLQIPKNIILMFQPPPHSPETNPIEQIWQYLKRKLRWELPDSLAELFVVSAAEPRLLISQELAEMTEEIIADIAGRSYILSALFVIGI